MGQKGELSWYCFQVSVILLKWQVFKKYCIQCSACLISTAMCKLSLRMQCEVTFVYICRKGLHMSPSGLKLVVISPIWACDVWETTQTATGVSTAKTVAPRSIELPCRYALCHLPWEVWSDVCAAQHQPACAQILKHPQTRGENQFVSRFPSVPLQNAASMRRRVVHITPPEVALGISAKCHPTQTSFTVS